MTMDDISEDFGTINLSSGSELVTSQVEDDSGFSEPRGRELLRSVRPAELKLGQTYDCSILQVDSPCQFLFRLEGSDEKVHQISYQLEKKCRSNTPRGIAWQVGDCCSAKFRGLGWARAVITSIRVEAEVAEVMLVDHGKTGTVALRLLHPLPEVVSQTDWLSFSLKVLVVVPDTYQWSKEVRRKVTGFWQHADRVRVKVTGAGEEPNKWLGEIFFYIDLIPSWGPVRTHRFRASRILGTPDISIRERIRCLKNMCLESLTALSVN